MAVDRDHRQVQRQKNQHTVNCHKAENANHDNSSPEVKPKQSSKSPKTTRRKVLNSLIVTATYVSLLLYMCVVFKEV